MADAKTTALTAATSWASGDLLYLVRDPAGTPVSRKITVDNILQNLVCAANTSLIKSTTGYSLTGSNAQSMIDLAGTWNTTGTPTLIKANVTNTASNAASLLMDLQVGGVGVFRANNLGVLFLNGGSTGSVARRSDVDMLMLHSASTTQGVIGIGAAGYNHGINITATASLAWTNDTPAATRDVVLLRDAANTLALRNAANAQAFRLYGTYTDASNYRRLLFTMSTAGVAEITPVGAGTGASGNVLHISGLPTSNPGPGILWNNAGTPAIGT